MYEESLTASEARERRSRPHDFRFRGILVHRLYFRSMR